MVFDAPKKRGETGNMVHARFPSHFPSGLKVAQGPVYLALRAEVVASTSYIGASSLVHRVGKSVKRSTSCSIRALRRRSNLLRS